MEIISLQLCLQQLLPQICWAWSLLSITLQNTFVFTKSLSRHVQVTAKGSTQLFFISHQINQCFYLCAVLNKPSCYNVTAVWSFSLEPQPLTLLPPFFNWFSVFIFRNINIHILRTHLGISLEFFSYRLVPGCMEHQVHNAEVQTLTDTSQTRPRPDCRYPHSEFSNESSREVSSIKFKTEVH